MVALSHAFRLSITAARNASKRVPAHTRRSGRCWVSAESHGDASQSRQNARSIGSRVLSLLPPARLRDHGQENTAKYSWRLDSRRAILRQPGRFLLRTGNLLLLVGRCVLVSLHSGYVLSHIVPRWSADKRIDPFLCADGRRWAVAREYDRVVWQGKQLVVD